MTTSPWPFKRGMTTVAYVYEDEEYPDSVHSLNVPCPCCGEDWEIIIDGEEELVIYSQCQCSSVDENDMLGRADDAIMAWDNRDK